MHIITVLYFYQRGSIVSHASADTATIGMSVRLSVCHTQLARITVISPSDSRRLYFCRVRFIAYTLQLTGTTVMIKGTLLMSLPIIFKVRKRVLFAQFFGPLEKPLEGYV